MKLLSFFLLLSLPPLRAAVTAGEMLMNAISGGDLKTMESLLSAGVDPNLPDPHGQTPLYLAMRFDQPAVVELLLTSHADPNAPVRKNAGQYSVPPLQYATQSGNFRIASILIAAGAD